jgi:hypothetical protein
MGREPSRLLCSSVAVAVAVALALRELPAAPDIVATLFSAL